MLRPICELTFVQSEQVLPQDSYVRIGMFHLQYEQFRYLNTRFRWVDTEEKLEELSNLLLSNIDVCVPDIAAFVEEMFVRQDRQNRVIHPDLPKLTEPFYPRLDLRQRKIADDDDRAAYEDWFLNHECWNDRGRRFSEEELFELMEQIRHEATNDVIVQE